MYYKSKVKGVVRVDPSLFNEKVENAIVRQLKFNLEGNVVEALGKVIAVLKIKEVGEGILVPGDGAAYYKATFDAIHFIPEIQEIVEGEIKDIAKFGAFIDFGPFEGMVHISQTMDDFVSVSKQGTLQGKDSKKVLKIGDKVRARIVAVSLKDLEDPKIGLTMRQPYLGKLEWIEELRTKEAKAAKKAAAQAAKATKK